jgi:glycosyltransferase involved in cell wall biosynthesis
MRVAINAASAQMGGAATYLRNILLPLHQVLSMKGGSIIVWAPRGAVPEGLPGVEQRDFTPARGGAIGGIPRRLWFDQWQLPRHIRRAGVDALFSSANFGTLRSPVPQVLLVRNSLYFDPLAMNRIRSHSVRARYVAQRMLTLTSVRAADVVLFPSRAMRELVARHTDAPQDRWLVAPYGTRHDLFHPDAERPSGEDRTVLLNVSLYCDQKNLTTLLAAVDRLRVRAPDRYRLRLTAGLRTVEPSAVHPNLEADRDALARLERGGIAEDLGAVAYRALPEVYRAADLFVFPSYTESFGHPLVEAMASGLPVVAADVPINREMCGEAAVYFAPFDPDACAAAIESVRRDPTLRARLRREGVVRAQAFTWTRHVQALWDALRGAR